MYRMVYFFFLTTLTYAQIDTSVYYPLEIGNYWEYKSEFGDKYFYSKVTKDTLMSNGKIYFEIKHFNFQSQSFWYQYERFENKQVYRYSNDADCAEEEYLLFDFTVPDSTLWPICLHVIAPDYRGLFYTYYYWIYPFNSVFETKRFDYIIIENNDTLWSPFGYEFWHHIGKGIGHIHRVIEGDANYIINAAIINGVKYGNLFVSTDENYEIIPEYYLYDNYPNPFNPSTRIEFEIPFESMVSLMVYDILGNEVASLVDEKKERGSYSINFNASHLPSGIYIYTMSVNDFVQSKKMSLIK